MNTLDAVICELFPYLAKRYKPHIRRRDGVWVCHIDGDLSKYAGRGDSTLAAYMDWLRRARDA